MAAQEATPSLSQAQRLKRYSQEGKLSEDVMDAIMSEEKKEVDRITLTSEKLKQYFPKSFTPRQMEETIFRLSGMTDAFALETYQMMKGVIRF